LGWLVKPFFVLSHPLQNGSDEKTGLSINEVDLWVPDICKVRTSYVSWTELGTKNKQTNKQTNTAVNTRHISFTQEDQHLVTKPD
jgi:hypothetical protein